MPTFVFADDAAVAFDKLARELANGAEVDANRVVVVTAAAGRSIVDLKLAVDRLAASRLAAMPHRHDHGPTC